MANIIVAGAGSTEVNGTYVENGTVNERPLFIMSGESSYPRIYWASSAWNIAFANLKAFTFYKSTDDVATPNLCTTWSVNGNGQTPVPTVTAENTFVVDDEVYILANQYFGGFYFPFNYFAKVADSTVTGAVTVLPNNKNILLGIARVSIKSLAGGIKL